MALTAGTRLGPYEILAPAGAGGMGEVYKTRDTRLDRTVAVKILPSHLTSREDRRLRFEREARAASSLNHPHICIVHDIGRQDGIDFLVMEWLDGETLDARLRKGPLPLSQFFEYAIQVAEGLDQAHQRGLIHRDLKPANIMLTKGGAKLLDFGLAKTKDAAAVAGADATGLPTMTKALTQEGTIMGTFQYMAPEQLEGKEADARSDIFAFGTVLYEMASGRKAFTGRSQATLISSIMTADPPPLDSGLPGAENLPPSVDHVIRRCLAKDPADRWQTIHDLLLELKWASQSGERPAIAVPAAVPRRNLSRVLLAALMLAVVAMVAEALALFLRPTAEPPHAVRFTIPLPPKLGVSSGGGSAPDTIAVSPDGNRLVFTAAIAGQRMLYYRPLDSVAVQPLAGTEGAAFPFWSPDSRFVAFFADRKLKKMDILGGPSQEICDLPVAANGTGGSWGRDGTILFSVGAAPLQHVPATGGQPQPALDLDRARQEVLQRWPQFLPDGRHFAYYSFSVDSGKTAILLGELGSRQTRVLVSGTRRVAFVAPGWLFFERQQSLLAQPFNLGTQALTADATPVANLGADPNSTLASRFSISSNGTLVYLNGVSGETRVTWYNRDGKRLTSVGEPGVYPNMTLSPDGKRVALQRVAGGPPDIWVVDLSSGIQSRLTFGSYPATDPTWSADGRHVAYTVVESGKYSIRRKPIGGGLEETLLQPSERIFPQDSLKDGTLVCVNLTGKAVYKLGPGEKKLQTLIESPFDKDEPHVSPDGRWIAYGSTESGRWEVFVAAFPSMTEKRQVSSGGGAQPLWRSDGKELYYVTLDGAMTAMDVKLGAAGVETGPPRTLFQTKLKVGPTYDQYRATGDGQKFLILDPVEEGPQEFTVVLNAAAGLRR